jgi:hypothetical protein
MSDDPVYRDSPIKDSFRHGMEFQDYVCLTLAKRHIILQNFCSKKYQFEHGENLQGFEIKLDKRSADTGRLAIETAEKRDRSSAEWTPSGICRGDNQIIYIVGSYDRFFMFSTKTLLLIMGKHGHEPEEFNGTIMRFFLSMQEAERYCIKSFDKQVDLL